MAITGFVLGFADFALALPLDETSVVISNAIFGEIPFVAKEDTDDSSPSLILKNAFMGVVAELFGSPNHYTIEIGTRPSASVEGVAEVADMSAILKQQLERLPGIALITMPN